MSRIAHLLAAMDARGTAPALAHGGEVVAYADLARRRALWSERLRMAELEPGALIAIKSDFSFEAVALLLAVLEASHVAVLVPPSSRDDATLWHETRTGWRADPAGGTLERLPGGLASSDVHPLVQTLRDRSEGGFVVFSSGSTGRPKAVLHGTEGFLAKFEHANKPLSTLAFLLFDHIAGLDTLFYALASGGLLVIPAQRDSEHVCQLIVGHRVEVLPTSPSFLRLLCLSGAADTYDLSCLKIITYGSEPMDQATLDRVRRMVPSARLVQKYGMSEFGAPPSRSRDDGSLWLKLGGDGFQTRVVDGILWVKSPGAMLGYLNAPSPFDAEGWLCTGDSVETDGEWIRIRGRQSDLIIVGGEKVYPHEVESVLLLMDEVRDVVVRGQKTPLMGQIVTAEVEWLGEETDREITRRIRQFCRERLAPHKVPVAATRARAPLSTARQKRVRTAGHDSGAPQTS